MFGHLIDSCLILITNNVDWIATFLLVISQIQLARGKKIGFLTGIVANAFWIWFSVQIGSVAMVLINIFISICAVKAYYKFVEKENT